MMKYYINNHNFPFIPEPVPFTCLFCFLFFEIVSLYDPNMPWIPCHLLPCVLKLQLYPIMVGLHVILKLFLCPWIWVAVMICCGQENMRKVKASPFCPLSERVLPLALLDPAFPWEQSRISLLKNEKSPRAKPRHVSHGHHQSHP